MRRHSPAVIWLVHESPLHTTRESSPTSTSQTRLGDFLDDPIIAFQNDLFCLVPVSLECEISKSYKHGMYTSKKPKIHDLFRVWTVDFKVSCSQIARRAFAGIRTHFLWLRVWYPSHSGTMLHIQKFLDNNNNGTRTKIRILTRLRAPFNLQSWRPYKFVKILSSSFSGPKVVWKNESKNSLPNDIMTPRIRNCQSVLEVSWRTLPVPKFF
jgi:hypothetical protein